jgi:hypothetical protein
MHFSRRHAPLLGLATLVGLAAAPAARAQSLTLGSGDDVTVDGAGTHGTINNATTSYTDSGGGYAVYTNGSAMFTLGAGGALAVGDNADAVVTYGSSVVTVTGGTLTAGPTGYGLLANGTGPITISGGSFTAGDGGVGLFANGLGSVTVTGGTFTTTGTGGFDLYSHATMDLYGAFDGLSLGQTETFSSLDGNGSFTGTLEDNTAAQTFTYGFDHNPGTITLHDVAPAVAPEPSSVAAFAFTGLFAAGLMLRARKRRPAAQ